MTTVQRFGRESKAVGAKIEAGSVRFGELEAYLLDKGNPAANASGRQEMLENLINR